MFVPKDYLRVEWANIERTLRETLRYRYTERDTSAYYQECASRLKYARTLLESVPETDYPGLSAVAAALHGLSDLIAKVERSHLEEFSWPFAYALKRMAADVCTETPISGSTIAERPLFFFTAEGGMCSYAVRPETPTPGLVGQKIYSVIFPRTLKDSVLLHAIIGHEIGHAAIATQRVRSQLIKIIQRLIDKSVVADPNKLFDWCQKHLSVTERVSAQYLAEQAESWAEEFYCDLFGLLTMGPCFLPAFQALLQPLSKFANGPYVPSHPPFEARMLVLEHAAQALGLLYSEPAPRSDLGSLTTAVDESFKAVAKNWHGSHFAILDKDQIIEAATALQAFATAYPTLAFKEPDADLLSQLNLALKRSVPPVGPFPAAAKPGSKSEAGLKKGQLVDFRHILLAGWIRWSNLAAADSNDSTFRQINSLCSHAILQQEGVYFWNEAKTNSLGTAP